MEQDKLGKIYKMRVSDIALSFSSVGYINQSNKFDNQVLENVNIKSDSCFTFQSIEMGVFEVSKNPVFQYNDDGEIKHSRRRLR